MTSKYDPVLEGARTLLRLAKETANKTGEDFALAAKNFFEDPNASDLANDIVSSGIDIADPENLQEVIDDVVRNGGSIYFGVFTGALVTTTTYGGLWNPAWALGIGEFVALQYQGVYDFLKEGTRRGRGGIILYNALHWQEDARFDFAQGAVDRRDPLTLDLDGDGLETVPATAGVLFDHDADGIATKRGKGSGLES